MSEIWKTITGFEAYECSQLGNIRNKKTGRLLKPSLTKSGNMIVCLRKDNRSTTKNLANLIAKTWLVNDTPNMKRYVHHKDFDNTNNSVDNLEWTTRTNDPDNYYANLLSNEITKLVYKYKDNVDIKSVFSEILLFVEDTLTTNSYNRIKIEVR